MWRRLAIVALAVLGVLVAALAAGELAGARVFARIGALAAEARPPIVVGVIHSLTGPSGPFERPMRDAELFAVAEINARGGVGGRLLRVVEADGRSDPRTFAAQARKLIEADKACVLFGGWTSGSRKAMKPVVEELGGLLVFPAEFEGMERSPHIFYAGPTANQQVVPAVRWALEALRARRPFLLVTDEVWSKAVAAIARDQLKASGVEACGEVTLPFGGGGGVAAAAEAIAKAQPDLILNFSTGEANAALFPALRRAGVSSKQAPALSFRMSEDDARRIDADDLAGHYIASDYFSSIDLPAGLDFLRRFRAHFGDDRTPSAPAVIAYEAVMLWAVAAGEAGDPDAARVLGRLPRTSLDAPEGIVTVDPENLATWRPSHVGRARADGRFEVVWSIERPVRPLTYTITRTNAEWDAFLEDLRANWNGRWSGDGKAPPPPG